MKKLQRKPSAKFHLIDWYYIRNFDEKNWIIWKTYVPEKWKKEYERISWYFPTLEIAWRWAINNFSLKASSNKDLENIVKRLEIIKEILSWDSKNWCEIVWD